MLNAIDTPLSRPSHTLTEKQIAAVAEYQAALVAHNAAFADFLRIQKEAERATKEADKCSLAAGGRLRECRDAMEAALSE